MQYEDDRAVNDELNAEHEAAKETHSGTWLEFIKGIFPEAKHKDVECILWECTAFPMCGNTHAKKQIQAMKDNSDGTLKDAIAKALAD